jgi:hypothetical protein
MDNNVHGESLRGRCVSVLIEHEQFDWNAIRDGDVQSLLLSEWIKCGRFSNQHLALLPHCNNGNNNNNNNNSNNNHSLSVPFCPLLVFPLSENCGVGLRVCDLRGADLRAPNALCWLQNGCAKLNCQDALIGDACVMELCSRVTSLEEVRLER